MKKLTALLLAVMMLAIAVLVASCGTQTVDTTAENTEAKTVATEPDATEATDATDATTVDEPPVEPPKEGYTKPEGYENVDFGGYVFKFVTTWDPNDAEDAHPYRWCTKREISVDTRTGGTTIDTAVYDRNYVMNQLYNCTIEVVHEGNAGDLISNDVSTGATEVDFGTWQYGGFQPNKSGIYLNLCNLNLDMNLPGWNQTWFDQTTVRDSNGADHLYTFDADFNLSGYRATWVLYCNLDLYDSNCSKWGGESIFDIVNNGTWTVDKMMEMIAAVTFDSDGDQDMKEGTDTFGLMTSTYQCRAFITSVGMRFVTCDENHNFSTSTELILANDAVNAITKVSELYQLPGVYVGSYSLAADELQAGRTLFMGEVLDVLERMADNEDLNVTIVPEPLYTASDNPEYKFYVNTKATYYTISKNACKGNTNMAANFLNVFVYHTNKIVYPAFVEAYGAIYCQDERAVQMLDYIVNGRQYDYGFYVGTALGQTEQMISDGNNKLSRTATTFVTGLQSEINTLVSNMTASE